MCVGVTRSSPLRASRTHSTLRVPHSPARSEAVFIAEKAAFDQTRSSSSFRLLCFPLPVPPLPPRLALPSPLLTSLPPLLPSPFCFSLCLLPRSSCLADSSLLPLPPSNPRRSLRLRDCFFFFFCFAPSSRLAPLCGCCRAFAKATSAFLCVSLLPFLTCGRGVAHPLFFYPHAPRSRRRVSASLTFLRQTFCNFPSPLHWPCSLS